MRKPTIAVLLLLTLCGCSPPAIEEVTVADPASIQESSPLQTAQADWPWWRGSTLDAHATGLAPPTSWSESENVLWKSDVPGRGHATPCVWQQQVFVATADEQNETMSLLCFNRATGEQEWNTEVHRGGFMSIHHKNSQASASPACDGERVIAVFNVKGSLWVSAVDLDGKIAWQTETGPFEPRHGLGTSPVLYKSLVIVAGDHTGSSYLAALDRETGKIVWRVPRTAGASYAAPIVANIGGQDQILLHGGNELISYDPHTGKQLWKTEGPSKVAANTPAWRDDMVFVSGGYPEKGVWGIKVSEQSGSFTAEVVWRYNFKAYVPSLLVIEDRLLAVGDDGVAVCMEQNGGVELWKKRLGGGFSASPVLADGLVYVPNEAGTMFVFEAGQEYRAVAENQLSAGGFASPVICDGKIFLRTNQELYCISRGD